MAWSQRQHAANAAQKAHSDALKKHADNPKHRAWVKHHAEKSAEDRKRHEYHQSGAAQRHRRKGGRGGYFAHARKSPAQRRAWQQRARRGGHPHANDKVW